MSISVSPDPATYPVWNRINSFSGNSTSPALTQYRPCPVCNGFDSRPLLTLDDFQFYYDSADWPKRITVRQVQCLTCQAMFMNPAYSNSGQKILFASAGNSYRSRLEHQIAQVQWLSERGLAAPHRVIVDIGCYDGKFLSLLPEHVRKLGVDIDQVAIARGRSKGLELTCGAFETFRLSTQPDVITMFHVLEHLLDPHEVLENLRSNSHAETRLVIEVPVIEKGHTNDLGGFFSIQHMTHFSVNSLHSLIQRSGWEILERAEMPAYNGYRLVAKPQAQHSAVLATDCATDRVAALRYLQSHFANLATICERINAWPETRRAVVWGAGAHTEVLYQATDYFREDPQRQYILVDSAAADGASTWRGLNIYNPVSVLKGIDWTDCALVISSYGWQDAIEQSAIEAGVPRAAVRKIYDQITTY